MPESHRERQERMRQAVENGGPAAVLDALSGMGAAVERQPEAGVGLRVRSGAGTADGFTTTMYQAAAERPAGWPAAVPFLPHVGGSLTLFDQPGHGFSVQWWKVPDPSAAAQVLIDQCLAAGWREPAGPSAMPPMGLPGTRTVVLEREDARRTLSSLAIKDVGFVQVLESRRGPSERPAPSS